MPSSGRASLSHVEQFEGIERVRLSRGDGRCISCVGDAVRPSEWFLGRCRFTKILRHRLQQRDSHGGNCAVSIECEEAAREGREETEDMVEGWKSSRRRNDAFEEGEDVTQIRPRDGNNQQGEVRVADQGGKRRRRKKALGGENRK